MEGHQYHRPCGSPVSRDETLDGVNFKEPERNIGKISEGDNNLKEIVNARCIRCGSVEHVMLLTDGGQVYCHFCYMVTFGPPKKKGGAKSDRKGMRDRMERCRKFGDITDNGVVFESWITGPQGARFVLFREPHHTLEDIRGARRYLRRNHDVVSISVQIVK